MKAHILTPEELATVEAEAAQEPSRGEVAAFREESNETFLSWDHRLAPRLDHNFEYNKHLSENTHQWGKVPGRNFGNGAHEASMPLELFLSLSSETGPFKGDPDWWKNDQKFYRWLRGHPGHDSRPGRHNS